MTIRSKFSPWLTRFATSDALLERRRQREERRRKNVGERHTVRYFHQADDPYSLLTAQVLPRFHSRYDIVLEPHLVPGPPDWAAPERRRLFAYSRRDVAHIAPYLGLSFSDSGLQPNPALLVRAQRIHAQAMENASFAATAAAIDSAIWHDQVEALAAIAREVGMQSPDATRKTLERGDELRDRLGHYLGATFYYGGEWYWGVDRLHHLERRLHSLGAYTGPEPFAPLYEPPPLRFETTRPPRPDTPPLEFFLSLRSPYTYLAVDRTIALAEHYGLDLRFRYVLPMVMRGLPLAASKRIYIMRDCKREANRLAVSFGTIADPVGRPVERGLAVLQHSIAEGLAKEYLTSFMRGVWAEGVDMDSNRGLRTTVERAGLDWSKAAAALTRTQWRDVAEENRNEMFAESIWGVPAFRFGTFAIWGQDRLWLLENKIVEHLKSDDEPESAT